MMEILLHKGLVHGILRGNLLPSKIGSDPEMDKFILEDANPSPGSPSRRHKKRRPADSDSSEEDELGPSRRGPPAPPPLRPLKTQVIFCSRTHSQLSQFIGELRRTDLTDRISVVALASRKVYTWILSCNPA